MTLPTNQNPDSEKLSPTARRMLELQTQNTTRANCKLITVHSLVEENMPPRQNDLGGYRGYL
jgi:hypothetical protein